jgi:hypothetical protein
MKTINVTRIFIIALLVGFLSTFSAYAESPAAISAKNIRQKFVEAVMNPEDMLSVPSSGEVEVLFKINDEGNVDMKDVKTTNKEAAKYVTEKINDVTCQNFVHPYNQYYKIKFTFRKS